MGFRIQHNVVALNSHRNLIVNEKTLNKSLERLSSGYRINSAGDDAAGMAASMRLRAEIGALKVAARNATEATSLMQVAEGALSQIEMILIRMKELAVQAASANTGSDSEKIDLEATQLEEEITRIIGFTEYDGKKLLDGTFGSAAVSSSGDFTAANGIVYTDVSRANAAETYTATVNSAAQTITLTATSDGSNQTVSFADGYGLGANETYLLNFDDLGVKIKVDEDFTTAIASNTINTGDTITTATARANTVFQLGAESDAFSRLAIILPDLRLDVLNGGSYFDIDLNTQATSIAALDQIDNAISILASGRAYIGASLNRIAYTSSNLAVSIENKTASESVIRDVDMAAEMSEFTKSNILVQAGMSMLAQANQVPQSVLQLLR